MSIIKINCPQCKQEVVLEKSQINKAQGRVDCPHCAHVFHLVKKSKPQKDKAIDSTISETNTVNDDLSDIEALFRNTDSLNDNTAMNQTVNKEKKAAQIQPKPSSKLVYRIPKAPFKAPQFVEVGSQEETFAFNLLDRNEVEKQIPQVAIKPSSNHLPIPVTRTGEQQNNITIHTDSLVFTLVGDGQSPIAGMPQGQMMSTSNNLPSPITVTASNEMNWTIATIGALIVLILQLFNLIMMLI